MSGETGLAIPAAEPTQDEKAYAGLAHALMIPTWWIGPLVILLLKKESRFVKFHAGQALFWQLVYTAAYVLGMIALFATMFASMLSMPQGKTAQPPQFPIALFAIFPVFWLLIFGGMTVSLALGIVYCLKAMRGEWAGYPLIGRWTRKILGV